MINLKKNINNTHLRYILMALNRKKMGQVKWFNNKAGYGFITMTDDAGAQMDIFIHYSTVHVQDIQYKFLVQGEYVEFDLVDSTSEKHKYQATNVTGINGGKLMCETRQMNRSVGEGKSVMKELVCPTPVPQCSSHQEQDEDTEKYQRVVTKRGSRNMRQHRRPEGGQKCQTA
jgi:cold shock CspA family protein